MIEFSTLKTSMGIFGISTNQLGVLRVHLPNDPINNKSKTQISKQSNIMKQAVIELKQYFNGKRKSFEIKWDLDVPPFYQKILMEVSNIPFGKTLSYQEIAIKAGNPKAFRAAGTANAKNPVPIFIPCHRVINSNGSLGGYGGGLQLKKNLLVHEGCYIES